MENISNFRKESTFNDGIIKSLHFDKNLQTTKKQFKTYFSLPYVLLFLIFFLFLSFYE